MTQGSDSKYMLLITTRYFIIKYRKQVCPAEAPGKKQNKPTFLAFIIACTLRKSGFLPTSLIPSRDSEAHILLPAGPEHTVLLLGGRHSALKRGVGKPETPPLLPRRLRFSGEDNFNNMAKERYSGSPQKGHSTEPGMGGLRGGGHTQEGV